jgi:uncharacterized membrane protein
MEKERNDKWDNVKTVLWFIVMIEVLILLLAIINGTGCGYKNSFVAFGVIGLIIGAGLLLLVAAMILVTLILKAIENNFSSRQDKQKRPMTK